MIPAKFGLMVAQRLDAADRLIGDMAALQAERAAMRADIDAALVLHEKTKALSADGKLMAARALRRLYASLWLSVVTGFMLVAMGWLLWL